MNNAYYILAKEAVPIERLHICTWEFPNANSYIEFGLELSYKNFVHETLEIWLSVPFIKDHDEVNCLLKNLSDNANCRFIFNDIVECIKNVGTDSRDGSILKFEGRQSLTILPCKIIVSNGFLKFTLNKPKRYEGNFYFRVLVKHNGTIAIKKTGIAKNTYIYDLKINETRNLPDDIYDLKSNEGLHICPIQNLFCLHSVPDDFDITFIDSSKLKNIRKLETEAFKRYLQNVKDIGKDCYNIIFLKDCNKDSYSLFTICAEETIGSKQISLAIATNIVCSLLFFVYSVRTGIESEKVWYIQMPWEGIFALLVLVVLCLYLFPLKKKK